MKKQVPVLIQKKNKRGRAFYKHHRIDIMDSKASRYYTSWLRS